MALERQDARLELERQSQVPLKQPLPACGQLEPIAPPLSLLTAGPPWGLPACMCCLSAGVGHSVAGPHDGAHQPAHRGTTQVCSALASTLFPPSLRTGRAVFLPPPQGAAPAAAAGGGRVRQWWWSDGLGASGHRAAHRGLPQLGAAHLCVPHLLRADGAPGAPAHAALPVRPQLLPALPGQAAALQ